MAITEEEFQQLQANIARNRTDESEKIWQKSLKKPLRQKTLPHPYQTSRTIPKTEKIYQQHLEHQKHAGEIVRYWHEPFKLILTHGIPGKVNEMSYTVDFMVEFAGHLRCVEVKANKASEHEDSWIKLKTACELFPCFEFVKVYVDTRTGKIKEEHLT